MPQTAERRQRRERAQTDDEKAEGRAALKAELDELLDEVDSVLEENAALVAYRQRGGQ